MRRQYEKPFVPPRPFEDLTFHASPRPTVGVELELQILDTKTGELAPGVERILDACEEEGLDGVASEFLLSMIEVRTGICDNIEEVRNSLVPLIRQVRNIARTLGYTHATGGTHPNARPCFSAVTPGERFGRIRRQQGWFAYQENIFGLHVHVGVPSGDEAIGVIGLLTPYLPHLLALSASSPFWEGMDTGFASARAVMFRPSANVGVPPHFAAWSAFCDYCRLLHNGGAIESTKNLYWDFRARPGYGTIEFRVFDAPASLDILFGMAALARSLVVDALRLLRERPQLIAGHPGNHWLASENKWCAARYGLQAQCVRRPGRERLSLADDTASLLDRLTPVARDLGDGAFLGPLQACFLESAADHQRSLLRRTGRWQTVVRDNVERLAQDIKDATQDNGEPELNFDRPDNTISEPVV